MSEMRIDGPQGTLVADVGGAGDHLPVLFLHSDGGNAGQWAKQLARLRPTRQAIALDLRGHGRSDAPRNGDYSIVGRADDVAAAVDALGLARLVVVGHSGGGAVGFAVCGDAPGAGRGSPARRSRNRWPAGARGDANRTHGAVTFPGV